MKRPYGLLGIILILFLVELAIVNFLGPWFKPNLLLLLVIFVDLHLGSRWGIFVAITAGILKDSFGTGVFGMHIFSFILCVYATTLTRKFIFYDLEFGFLRILMAFLMCVLNLMVNYFILSMFEAVEFYETFLFVILPEVVMTTVAASFVFKGLKRCVLKLSV